jgi:hypothetical protein
VKGALRVRAEAAGDGSSSVSGSGVIFVTAPATGYSYGAEGIGSETMAMPSGLVLQLELRADLNIYLLREESLECEIDALFSSSSVIHLHRLER